MIDLIFALVAIGVAGGAPSDTPPQAVAQNGTASGTATAEAFPMPAGLLAEPQTPSGKFTTATEVKPILTATKGNWIGVRNYGGNDLLYLTHLWSWRCGLADMAISVNGGPAQAMPLPACHSEYATPNAILEQDGLPYLTYPQDSVSSVTVHLIYDDLSRDSATYARGDVLIP